MFACIHGSPLAEDQLKILIDCAYGFSPVVERTSSDSVTLDAHGTVPLFGPPHELCARIAGEARRHGVSARVAVSADPDTALLAALGCETDCVVPPGREREFLSSLPIRLLQPETFGIPIPKTDAEEGMLPSGLELWGIRTIGAFADLPDAGVFERLGAAGAELQRIARGRRSRPLIPILPAPGFEFSTELEHPVDLREALLFTLASLINRLCASLDARSLAAREFAVRLALENGSEYRRSIHPATPSRDHKLLLKLTDVEIEAHPPESAVTSVILTAEPIRPRRRQGGLFEAIQPEPHKLELHLARIAKLVGAENAGSPEIPDTHRPRAFRMRRFEPRGAPAETRTETPLALRVFRPPRRAAVRLNGDAPAHLSAAGLHGRIVRAAGPWRASGDWWSQESWSRDEWDVQLEGGCICRIYRDAVEAAWFVEGIYD